MEEWGYVGRGCNYRSGLVCSCYGGVTRDNGRRSLWGFPVTVCLVLEVEMWRTFEGVKVAWEKGVKKIVLEMDCIEAINMLSGHIRDQNLLRGRVKIYRNRWKNFK
ncbi:hypothetical protein PVK06_011137 [Gossypium arboreum]|uniref:RNase H type-1 domain-containing protein n=1 Tax=Gossypium arboreum TaxID=29729 RepID=A0ABR0Q993_GOSAR|nr:hypothetical protein PVK06_011137 [Gossypium arboreum]